MDGCGGGDGERSERKEVEKEARERKETKERRKRRKERKAEGVDTRTHARTHTHAHTHFLSFNHCFTPCVLTSGLLRASPWSALKLQLRTANSPLQLIQTTSRATLAWGSIAEEREKRWVGGWEEERGKKKRKTKTTKKEH